ncbi:MAG TPA: M56 family metallopeptidase [Ruania sp.]|nr:M56 family metallopeptidase [Ruania sp.]
MTALWLATLLVVFLLLAGVCGPRLLRRAAPALAQVPRLAITLLLGSAALWLLAALAVGPVLAWGSNGPSLLGGSAGAVCRRCLASADPFEGAGALSEVPTAGPLAVSAVILAIVLTGLVSTLVGGARATRRAMAQLAPGLRARDFAGYRVHELDQAGLQAFAMPAGWGGIIVSTGCLHTLSDQELSAVLAHERAHLRQRHHLWQALMQGMTRFLGGVPLLRACRDALPHYLEIAADDAARRSAGTPALASALLTLGDKPVTPALAGSQVNALHAAGTDRIRHLVGAPQPGGTGPAVVAAVMMLFLGAAVLLIHLPYLLALARGCL